jgi:lipoate-protein ligase A
MNLIVSEDKNPYRNLATEEFLLKNSSEDFIFLYINNPCVVIGKHQIAPKEINSIFTSNNNILIARRLSGGGAVYHDNISYQQITKTVHSFLKKSGFEVILSPRNDLLISENKISGSAMHVYKNRVMAHCTLLVNCNLEHLSKSLKGNPERYQDRSINSYRTKVRNLADIDKQLTVDFLIRTYHEYLEELMPVQIKKLPDYSFSQINQLCINKYSAEEWIYGYSPKYIYQNSIMLAGKKISIVLEIEKGVIKKSDLESQIELNSDILLIINALKERNHNIQSVSRWLHKDFCKETSNQLLEFLF